MDDPTPTLHIDGAARGNPGPAAYAVVLARPGLDPVERSAVIGRATNNVAEYTALVRGLEVAAGLGLPAVRVFSDSELLVRQMNGEYKVKHPDLLPLYRAADDLRRRFARVTLTHVRREQNKRADALCNEALDAGRKPAGGTPSPGPPRESPAPSRGEGRAEADDAAVRDDAVRVLADAARHWVGKGMRGLPPEAVWDQLWSILAEAGVLRARKRG